MKPSVCLAVLAASLLAAPPAPAQPQRAPVARGRVQLLGADMAGSCKAGDIERARQLADACEGKQQCSFTPVPGDAAAESCARESLALWDCGDGKTRYAALGPQNKGQSREIRLECPPGMAAAAPPPALAASAPKPAPVPAPVATASMAPPHKPGDPETVTVDEIRPEAPAMRVPRPAVAGIDMSAAGVNRERMRGVCALFTDPTAGENPAARLAQLHGQIWDRPDHSPGAASNCGVKSLVPQSAVPEP
jgi:hypothetical protein